MIQKTVASSGAFLATNLVFRKVLPRIFSSYNLLNNEQQKLFLKHLVSFFHSVCSSVVVLLAWKRPKYFLKDLQYSPVPFAKYLFPFSLGYFIYDFAELVWNDLARKNLGLCLHHILSSAALIISGGWTICQPYVLMSLTAEFNSIFLHLRKILQLAKVSQSSLCWKLNTFALLLSFLIVRIGVHGFGLLTNIRNRKTLKKQFFLFGLISGTIVYLMNFVLLISLIKSVFRARRNINI